MMQLSLKRLNNKAVIFIILNYQGYLARNKCSFENFTIWPKILNSLITNLDADKVDITTQN